MEAIAIFFVLVFGFLIILFFLNSKFNQIQNLGKSSEDFLKIIEILKNSSFEDRKLLLDSLQKNTNSLNLRLDNTAKIIADVQKSIGEMSEIGRGIKELQDFLKSPKLRGGMGEHVLNELLAQVLPKQSFHLQYSFRNGRKVDAAIKTSAGIIPIDSKFPMENFRKILDTKNSDEKDNFRKAFERDVKLHIDTIAQKYISTEEGTIDYALMYVPSESVYYEIVNNADLFEYAGKKMVMPVSPTTFYAFLKAILMSFEGQRIEEKAKEVLLTLKGIQKEYTRVDQTLKVLQRHMNNANNTLVSLNILFGNLGQKVLNTKLLEKELKKDKD